MTLYVVAVMSLISGLLGAGLNAVMRKSTLAGNLCWALCVFGAIVCALSWWSGA